MATYYKIKAKTEEKEDGVLSPIELSGAIILPPYKSDNQGNQGAVISIAENGFSGQTGITSFIISENVKYIGDSAFSGCTGLTEMTIPASVTSMGASVFNGCDELTTVYLNHTADEIAALDSWNEDWLDGATNANPIYAPTYNITIDTLVNGEITVDKAVAKAGDIITLTVTPNDGYKVSWVRYNDKKLTSPYSFTMPAKNVKITAEFAQKESPDTPTTYTSITVMAPDIGGDNMETQTIQYNTEQNGYYFEIGSKISSIKSTITSQYPLVVEYFDNLTASWVLDEAAGGWQEEYKDNIYTYTETANTDIAGPIQQRACIKEV